MEQNNIIAEAQLPVHAPFREKTQPSTQPWKRKLKHTLTMR